ncbi:MAG: 1-acyl-sn-glycerol-3-phosphate acyltransferase [Clostridia bacterium]|nr:1-acyl-sn-glycerol-3-phosphate acyltransferase [Clostridia bacterium]
MHTPQRKHIKKPNAFTYGIFRILSKGISKFVFNYNITDNQFNGTSGKRVIIANHESAIDFLMLAAAVKEKMHFVISSSFYRSLPIHNLIDSVAVIPKNQFQTVFTDMRLIKEAVDSTRPLVIYPAGLMSENGITTPIPLSTGKTLKWLDADIYVAKISGTYLSNPKWSKIRRKGRVDLSITKLISSEEAKQISNEKMQEMVENALYFDAYKDNDIKKVHFTNGDNIEGLEHVIYRCPTCDKEFCMDVKDKNTLVCNNCNLTLKANDLGLFEAPKDKPDYKYPSHLSALIEDKFAMEIKNNPDFEMSTTARIHMINDKKHKFEYVGDGVVKIDRQTLLIKGTIKGEPFEKQIFAGSFPLLPFIPGKQFEIQADGEIYRILPQDPKTVVKWLLAIKSLYRIHKGLL